MPDTRTQNMEKRRERILQQARKMLADGGFDALNLRELAEESGITVPTIYNLIGNKAEVLKAMVMGTFADFEALLADKPPRSTAQLPALLMRTFATMIAEDEGYYRAAALASEQLENESGERSNYGFKRAPLRKFAGQLCREAAREGLLKGAIDSAQLVEQMIGNHQIAFRDWAHHVITLDELVKQSLRGFYIVLAADAEDDYRETLVIALKEL